ncbi:MAG: YihY/virulence factor BrkB family protein [Lachnospiraceae bacterium]|nr:YihY/virulence factor BrkB family protein [Lachnospiraceae bacterium]
MKQFLKRLAAGIGAFFNKSSEDSLPAYAAQATFFVIMSFFPFMMLLLMFISKLSFMNTDIVNSIMDIVPEGLSDYILFIINDIAYSNSASFTVVSIVVSLWSAAKGMQTLTIALDKIYKLEKRKNFILARIICSLYTLVFLILCIVVMVVQAFAEPIIKEVMEYFPQFLSEAMLISSLKNVFTFLVIFIFLVLIYYQLPDRKGQVKYEAVGAAIAALLWVFITKAFSLYIGRVAGASAMYGSLTSVILVFMWLYISMQVVLYGAEINYFLTDDVNKFTRRRKAKKRLKKDRRIRKKTEREVEPNSLDTTDV